jgi:hypothetical protein
MDKEHTEETHHEPHHEPTHKAKSRSTKFIIPGIVAGLVVVAGAALVWLYTGQITSAKEKVFKSVPLPAALVDMKPVSAKSVIERVELSKHLTALQPSAEAPAASDTFNLLLDAKKMEAVANQKKLTVKPEQIDEEYNNIITQYAQGDAEAFKGELEKTYKMTPEEFKKEVVRQELLESQISLWFNRQENLSEKGYSTAKDLQSKLTGGQSFEEVAKVYTQDESTKDFAGDSGVISFDDLLPEFREALSDNKVGDVELVPSRYGLHILKVLELNNDGENGSKQIHLQQIFVKQEGFNEWLVGEVGNVKVTKLLKFM